MATKALGLPQVIIQFRKRAESILLNGDGGVVALALRSAGAAALTVKRFLPNTELTAVDAEHANYIRQAFLGGCREVIAVTQPAGGAGADWGPALNALEMLKFTVCAFPGAAAADNVDLVQWAKTMATLPGAARLVVLAHADEADHPMIVNFATDDITVNGQATPLAATDYVARIAGAIAGVPLTRSTTYLPLPEVTDVPHLKTSEADALIKEGKLILYHDGEKVKIARGVTSLTTVDGAQAKFTAEWRKIKAVRTLNLIREDIQRTVEDNYVGKVPNGPTERLMLLSEVGDYLQSLESGDVLQAGTSVVEFDLVKLREYLKTILSEHEVDAMTDKEVLALELGDHVFLAGSVRPKDCIENMSLDLTV